MPVVIVIAIMVAIMVMTMMAIAPMARPIVVATAQRQPDSEQSGGDNHFRNTHNASPYSEMQ